MVDDCRQKLDLTVNEWITAWNFILEVDQNANGEKNPFETEQVASNLVKLESAAVSLAMCKDAGYPFQIEVDQSLRKRDFI